MVPSHYLNQRWYRLLTHICITRPQRINWPQLAVLVLKTECSRELGQYHYGLFSSTPKIFNHVCFLSVKKEMPKYKYIFIILQINSVWQGFVTSTNLQYKPAFPLTQRPHDDNVGRVSPSAAPRPAPACHNSPRWSGSSCCRSPLRLSGTSSWGDGEVAARFAPLPFLLDGPGGHFKNTYI